MGDSELTRQPGDPDEPDEPDGPGGPGDRHVPQDLSGDLTGNQADDQISGPARHQRARRVSIPAAVGFMIAVVMAGLTAPVPTAMAAFFSNDKDSPQANGVNVDQLKPPPGCRRRRSA